MSDQVELCRQETRADSRRMHWHKCCRLCTHDGLHGCLCGHEWADRHRADLPAVAARYSRALDAKPGKGELTHVDWLIDSVADIPDLLREVEDLRREVGDVD